MSAKADEARRLAIARDVTRDPSRHTYAAIKMACAVVIACSDDEAEVAGARELQDQTGPVFL